jgi:hypothetical protein
MLNKIHLNWEAQDLLVGHEVAHSSLLGPGTRNGVANEQDCEDGEHENRRRVRSVDAFNAAKSMKLSFRKLRK